MIDENAFAYSRSLDHFSIPASVTVLGGSAFSSDVLRSIEIEEGSASFRILNDLLVDFEVRSLVWVIGSPDSIVIPSSIEELGRHCCAWKELRTVEFERDSNLRSIGRFAFVFCSSLKSILIPSSVEVIHENCFSCSVNLQTVTFGCDSKLRLLERDAFNRCPSLSLVRVPASTEIVIHLLESEWNDYSSRLVETPIRRVLPAVSRADLVDQGLWLTALA
jgi:hypothetical protein